MPKKRIPGYRLHKPSGQGVVTLQGKDFYLGQYNNQASWALCQQLIADYLANDCKLPPTRTRNEITCEDLAIQFLEWARGYYVKDGVSTSMFSLCKLAIDPFIRHYGGNAVSEFGPLSLVFLRDKWVEQEVARPTINRWCSIIKQAFKWGVAREMVAPDIWHALQAVDGLKAGRTKATEYKEVEPVANEVVDKTLPFLPPVVADMVQVQRLAGLRPQDVRNLRGCDIDRSGDVWAYRPFTHKTKHRGKKRELAIGPRAQAILSPYLVEKADVTEDFVFSPRDSMQLFRAEQRKNRKSKVQPSQESRRRKSPKRQPGGQYSNDAYRGAVERAVDRYNKAEMGRAKVEGRDPVLLPKWTPNQLRHNAGTEATANFSLEAAKEFLGHSSTKTTEKYYVAPLPELAAQVARAFPKLIWSKMTK